MLMVAFASGVVWVPLGIAVSTLSSLFAGRRFPKTSNVLGQIPLLLAIGTVSGFFFSLIFTVGAGKRSFAGLSLLRVSALGAIGAAALPLSLTFAETGSIRAHGILTAVAIFGTVGALTTCGLLTLARRAPDTGTLDTPEDETNDQIGAGTA
jgi:hypothetical protein